MATDWSTIAAVGVGVGGTLTATYLQARWERMRQLTLQAANTEADAIVELQDLLDALGAGYQDIQDDAFSAGRAVSEGQHQADGDPDLHALARTMQRRLGPRRRAMILTSRIQDDGLRERTAHTIRLAWPGTALELAEWHAGHIGPNPDHYFPRQPDDLDEILERTIEDLATRLRGTHGMTWWQRRQRWRRPVAPRQHF